MKIIVDIPNDEDYRVTMTKIMLVCCGCSIIELPEGHGDLIDRQALVNNGIEKGFCDWYDEIKRAPTIIEADKDDDMTVEESNTEKVIRCREATSEEQKSVDDYIERVSKQNTWNFDDAREDFKHDVYNTLDFLPTNDEANRIIDSFDRVTSGIKCDVFNKIKTELEENAYPIVHGTNNHEKGMPLYGILQVIDKYITDGSDVK